MPAVREAYEPVTDARRRTSFVSPPPRERSPAWALALAALWPAAWIGVGDVWGHGRALPAGDAALAVALWSGFALPAALVAGLVGRALGSGVRGQAFAARLVGVGWAAAAVLALARGWLTPAGAVPLALLGVLVGGAARMARLAPLLAGGLLAAPVLAAFAGGAATRAPAPDVGAPQPEPRHVVLIVLDTQRADHLGAYGHPGGISPAFDAAAADARLYRSCFAPASWTVPSHASLFTGLYPRSHGTHFDQHRWLDDRFETLAEGLTAAGYRTLGLAANHHVALANLAQGFARYESLGMPRGLRLRQPLQLLGGPARWIDEGASEAAERVEAILGKDPQVSVPTFLFVNLLEPHWRYLPPAAERRRGLPAGLDAWTATRLVSGFFGPLAFARGGAVPQETAAVRAFYAAEVRYQDAQLARLLEVIDRRLGRERTLLVITSDHGENLGEAGRWDHVFAVNDHLIHVPMLVRAPGAVAPGVESGLCQLLDVPATVAAWTGTGLETGAGHSLLDEAYPGREAVFAEGDPFYGHLERMSVHTGLERDVAGFTARLVAARDERFKLVVSSRTGEALYDLTVDPDEETDVATAFPEQVARLREALAAWRKDQPIYRREAAGEAAGAGMSDAERELLETLGYVEP